MKKANAGTDPDPGSSANRRPHWHTRDWTCRLEIAVGATRSKEIHEIHPNRPEAEDIVRRHTMTDWDALSAELTKTATDELKKNFQEATKGMDPKAKQALLTALAEEAHRGSG